MLKRTFRYATLQIAGHKFDKLAKSCKYAWSKHIKIIHSKGEKRDNITDTCTSRDEEKGRVAYTSLNTTYFPDGCAGPSISAVPINGRGHSLAEFASVWRNVRIINPYSIGLKNTLVSIILIMSTFCCKYIFIHSNHTYM